jgi:hypothetical protein
VWVRRGTLRARTPSVRTSCTPRGEDIVHLCCGWVQANKNRARSADCFEAASWHVPSPRSRLRRPHNLRPVAVASGAHIRRTTQPRHQLLRHHV